MPRIGNARSKPPEGDLEQQLAAIWADVLGVAQIGRPRQLL